MKAPIIATTVLCLVAMACAAEVSLPIVNYEGVVGDLIKEAQEISLNTAKTLEAQYKAIVVEPLDQVDTEVQKIEDRREEDDSCVGAKDAEVQLAVNALHEELNVCGIVAAKSSANVINDVSAATQQLVFDGYDVLTLYQKCKHYKNSVLRNSCYAKLSIKATLYMKNARRSMKTIKSANQRIPPIFKEANECTHNSAAKTVIELDAIQAEVDACIQRVFK